MAVMELIHKKNIVNGRASVVYGIVYGPNASSKTPPLFTGPYIMSEEGASSSSSSAAARRGRKEQPRVRHELPDQLKKSFKTFVTTHEQQKKLTISKDIGDGATVGEMDVSE